ncbi:MAG: methyltransferase domain-containing protein [Spirochaetales bacterium]|nr:methyltransferase domain-containing protein [Spirochaetales bacterium]
MNAIKHHYCQSRRGPSSFWMQEPHLIFGEIKLKRGDSFLDLGCGVGDYSLEALKYVGKKGKIFSLDKNEKALNLLKHETIIRRIENIHPLLEDVTAPLSLKENSVDACLTSTVLHCMDLKTISTKVFPQVKKVLKDGAILSIVECHKKRTNFGPPEGVRISPEELEELALPHGFTKTAYRDLGHNYLLQLAIKKDFS